MINLHNSLIDAGGGGEKWERAEADAKKEHESAEVDRNVEGFDALQSDCH